MYKKLVMLILVLGLVGMASAYRNWINDGTTDPNWFIGTNWDAGSAPNPSDSSEVDYLKSGPIGPSIGELVPPVVATCRRLFYEAMDGPGITSTMDGGTLLMYYEGATDIYLRLGSGAATAGGVIRFNMTGGTMIVNVDTPDDLDPDPPHDPLPNKYTKGTNGYLRAGNGLDTRGELNMSGDAVAMAFDLIINDGGTVDLRDTAKIMVLEDDTAEMLAYIADGKLTAYGTPGLIEIAVVDDEFTSPKPGYSTVYTVITAAAGPPVIATEPDPAMNSGVWYDVSIDADPILSWTASAGATSHDVYFGIDADDVAAATNASPEFAGNQVGTSVERSVYYPAGLLDIGVTYYWRVDEVSGTTETGDVWSFTIDGHLGIANTPSPEDGADVWYDSVDETSAELSWISGGATKTHDVYFGTDADAVDAATNASPEFVGNQGSPSVARSVYHPAGFLELGQTYYWRIDEVEAGEDTLKGGVWEFSIYNYLVIDQFEDYIVDVNEAGGWFAAGGASTSLETSGDPLTRHTQSMKLNYDNTAAPFDSTVMKIYSPFTPAVKDWTRLDTKAFGLWFYVESIGNDALKPLHLTVVSSSGTATFTYGTMSDPEGIAYDNADLAVTGWHEWRIDAQDFTAQGVNMASISSVTIGIGDGTASAGTGTGTVWIDNVRMYPLICFNSAGPEGGDLTDDCLINLADFAVMAENWLDDGWWPVL